ncbi:unnamed protein product [Larinioides sclopetarius]|uniref:Uncharacterized protein n=1 Tax=Larinioides sclopetarius TaxID=280406 RepID=A0AAV1YTZ5_9ARAC
MFILLGIAIFRAAILPKEHLPVSCTFVDKDYISDKRGLSKRLSEALKFQTVVKHGFFSETKKQSSQWQHLSSPETKQSMVGLQKSEGHLNVFFNSCGVMSMHHKAKPSQRSTTIALRR